jgi:phosphatidylglycerophosphate synthase
VRGGPDPLVLWGIAAVTDFADGRVARRWGGPSRHGALADAVADVAFVLATFVTLAALGRGPWSAPLAIGAAVAAYAVASLRGSRAAGTMAMARSPLGHAAGVVNYAAAGVVLAAAAWPASRCWPLAATAAYAAVVLANLAAVVERSVRAELARRAPQEEHAE